MQITAVEQITTAPEDGQQGKPGPIPYPAGRWQEGVEYIWDEHSTPIILYVSKDGTVKQYYILMKDGISKNESPFEDYQNNGSNAKWHLFTNLQYLFTEIMLAEFGLIGGGLFSITIK